MKRMLGAPSFARRGSGQAWLDTSNVRPMTPVKAVPGLYSLSAMSSSFHQMPAYVATPGSRKGAGPRGGAPESGVDSGWLTTVLSPTLTPGSQHRLVMPAQMTFGTG